MQTVAHRLWTARIVTLALAGLAAASAAYWLLKAWKPPAVIAASAAVSQTMPVPIPARTLALALGGAVPTSPSAVLQPPPAASRYLLVGVVSVQSRAGTALISIDGQDARPVRVGGPVGTNLVLQSVTGRRAVLAPAAGNGESLTLELPTPGK